MLSPSTSTFNSTTSPSSYPITVGTHYFYKVSAQDADDNESELSNYDEGWAELQGPAAPTILNATDLAFPSVIKLDWNDVTGAGSYNVYTANTSAGPPGLLGDFVLSYANIYNVDYGATRYYWISSIDSLGTEGPLSNVFSGSTFKNGTVSFADDGTGNYIQYYTNEAGQQGSGWIKTYFASDLLPGSSLVTTVNKKSGSATAGQGVMFAFIDTSNFLKLIYNTNGSWHLEMVAGGSSTVFVDWVSSSWLNTGLDADNTITINYYYNSSDSNYYFDIYFNSSPKLYYLYNASPMDGDTGFFVYVSSISDDFPGTPVDVFFDQTSPMVLPSIAGAASAANTASTMDANMFEITGAAAEADTAASSDVAGPENEGAGLGELSPGSIWLE